MRFLFLSVALVGSLFGANAQHTGIVSGKVAFADQKESSSASATLSLLRLKDSVTIKQVASGKDGAYSFNAVELGHYRVTASAIGYQRTASAAFTLTQENASAQLPAILLKPVAKAMMGVTVTAKRPLIEHTIDRTIVNVEAAITNSGTSALEVLEKAPGVMIDKEGNISLKGKEGVLVMIDGRPTQLGGTDLANLLRNMNATQLDQVEIMTNPPARFDAAGNAGVINIKTKKSKTVGYNGTATVNYTQGRYPKLNEGFNFNYREGRANMFTNLSHGYRKGFEKLTIQRNIRNGTANTIENHFDQRGDRVMEGNSFNAKLGLDFFATKRTTYGIVFNGFTSPSTSVNYNRTNIASAAKELQSVTLATLDSRNHWKNFSSNLNFRTQFDSTGRELTADLDFMTFSSPGEQSLVNAYYDANDNLLATPDTLLARLPQQIKVYSGRMDYFHPLKKGAKLEAGIKSSIVRTDNNASYDSVQKGTLVHDAYRSNHFLYEENINAAYLNLSTPLSKKLSAQLGLRLENTNATGRQLTTGQRFDRNYTQLFPTAYFQYKLNKENNLALNYGRRIRRPNYENLNPFIRFMDRYTYSQGNPELKPQFSNNIELSHAYKNILTTTLNYSITTDILQSVIEQKGQEAYSKKANLASLRQYGLSVSWNNTITKWWTNSLYINVFNNNFEGVVNNIPIAFSTTRLTLNGSQQFKLSKTLSAELSGFYRTAGVEGVVRMKALGALSAGFSQQVLKNKGSIRLSVRDIFYTQKANVTTNYGNVDIAFQEVGDSRVVSLAFSYRFSKGKINSPKKRNTGSANEEENRIGVQ